jgi:FMN phosphatase YigB (HAD superfamily)
MTGERIAVVVFDLDGTLQRGMAPLERYAGEIAARLPGGAGARFKALAAAHLGGQGVLPGEDDWEALAALALDLGVAPGALRDAYFGTRLWMVEGDCPLEAPVGVAPFLARVRRTALTIVASNSPSSSVGPLLARMGLDGLADELASSVGKPAGLVPLVTRLAAAWGLGDRPVMSVGDNHKNDIALAQAQGWATAHVRSGREARPGATCSADTLEGLMPCILAWLDSVGAAEEDAARDA